MGSNLYFSSKSDYPLLQFLWRWKLVSTTALARKFWMQNKVRSSYNRLNELKSSKYINLKTTDWQDCSLWSLDKAGFSAIQSFLPELKETGYASEHRIHDWLTSAFHLGDWLIEAPVDVVLFSEQELRRLHPEHYPAWVSKDSTHRPDGYWHRGCGLEGRTVALEMELTRKLASAYQKVGVFYGDNPQIDRVLWVVQTISDAEAILKSLESAPGARSKIYSFVLVKSFLKNGWLAPIEYGSGKSLTVESFLRKALDCSSWNFPVQTWCDRPGFALLETRKKGIEIVTSANRRELNFS